MLMIRGLEVSMQDTYIVYLKAFTSKYNDTTGA